MEIKDVFDQSRADLSNINKQYFVSSMIHKTKISVDEYGTTAAAVSISCSNCSMKTLNTKCLFR